MIVLNSVKYDLDKWTEIQFKSSSKIRSEIESSRQNNWTIHKACDRRPEARPRTMTNKKLIRK